MATTEPHRPVASSHFRTGDAAASVEFRAFGSHQIHQGWELRLSADTVQFETDYAVAPADRLSLRIWPEEGDLETLEVSMTVLHVDTSPGDRFRVSGRLHLAD